MTARAASKVGRRFNLASARRVDLWIGCCNPASAKKDWADGSTRVVKAGPGHNSFERDSLWHRFRTTPSSAAKKSVEMEDLPPKDRNDELADEVKGGGGLAPCIRLRRNLTDPLAQPCIKAPGSPV